MDAYQQDSQEQIQNNDHDKGMDKRCRGGSTNSFRTRVAVKSTVTSKQSNRDTEK